MSAVELRLSPSDLPREMGAMRVWLDQHRFEPSGFSCRDVDDGVLVSLEFKIAHQAVAFAERRDGFVIRDVTFDARAAHQPSGFVAHALRLQRCRDTDVVAIVKNAPGNTTKGHGETFHFQVNMFGRHHGVQ